MKIDITQTVEVPISPYCGKCYRKNKDRNGADICELFSRFVYMRRGNFLKCRECYNALYDALEEDEA